jgi:hypothetical protein
MSPVPVIVVPEIAPDELTELKVPVAPVILPVVEIL